MASLTKWVMGYASRGGVQAGVRSAMVSASQGAAQISDAAPMERVRVQYSIAHNRWCERMQRAHKSNHIGMVALLRLCGHGGGSAAAASADAAACACQGMVYQVCMDPECRAAGFRGALHAIPPSIVHASRGGQGTVHH